MIILLSVALKTTHTEERASIQIQKVAIFESNRKQLNLIQILQHIIVDFFFDAFEYSFSQTLTLKLKLIIEKGMRKLKSLVNNILKQNSEILVNHLNKT